MTRKVKKSQIGTVPFIVIANLRSHGIPMQIYDFYAALAVPVKPTHKKIRVAFFIAVSATIHKINRLTIIL